MRYLGLCCLLLSGCAAPLPDKAQMNSEQQERACKVSLMQYQVACKNAIDFDERMRCGRVQNAVNYYCY